MHIQVKANMMHKLVMCHLLIIYFKMWCSHVLISKNHTHKEINLYFYYLQFGNFMGIIFLFSIL
jgi:hypothetical protein